VRALVLGSILVSIILIAANPAQAQSRGVQLTDDDTSVLVVKQLGQQQWVVVADMDFSTVTGNVFSLDGSSPVFLRCDIIDPDIFEQADFIGATVTIDCFLAGTCNALPCEDDLERWQPLGESQVVGSFFLP